MAFMSQFRTEYPHVGCNRGTVCDIHNIRLVYYIRGGDWYYDMRHIF